MLEVTQSRGAPSIARTGPGRLFDALSIARATTESPVRAGQGGDRHSVPGHGGRAPVGPLTGIGSSAQETHDLPWLDVLLLGPDVQCRRLVPRTEAPSSPAPSPGAAFRHRIRGASAIGR
jgi:hypothetical protein